jgi:Methyltransferase domain
LSRILKDSLAKAVCKVLPKLAWDKKCYRIFEQAGYHVTPNHFYSPIPDSSTLTDDLWKKESGLIGLDMNTDMQLKLLHEVFSQFGKEFDFPKTKDKSMQDHDFYLRNGSFEAGDAEVLHSMIRHFKPKRIVEIGSGFSTYLSARACLLNKEKEGIDTELIAIEPFPNETLKKGFPGLSALIQKPLEEVDLDLFRDLEANDILFVDSTHVLKIGGDVKYEYLEILPRLKKGVIVHSHDIFLPGEYPKSWVVDNHWFWTEQYLLQAFLAFNSAFEILWAGQYMARRYPDELITVFPSYQNIPLNNEEANHGLGSGSLWLRRRTYS